MADREWWDKVEKLYHAARELDVQHRARFLDEACDSAPALREKLDALLAENDQPDSILAAPALRFDDATLLPGSMLGPYELLGSIGAGGMGQVFRARDTRLKREVAIKALAPDFASDPAWLARFRREAKLLAVLNHPHIASIYDTVETANGCYLVLELLRGATLAERVSAGPVPVAEAIAIAVQIAKALEAAHEKGI